MVLCIHQVNWLNSCNCYGHDDSTITTWFFFFMAALCNRGDIIFLPCGFFFLSSIFFSSLNLGRHRLDVYHTSTHGVALVRIYNAGPKCAVHGSLDPKNHHLGTIAQLCWAISSQPRHISTI